MMVMIIIVVGARNYDYTYNANGDSYDGQWVEDQPHSWGLFAHEDIFSYDGEWHQKYATRLRYRSMEAASLFVQTP